MSYQEHYTIKRSRRTRSMRIRVHEDASVTVTIPWFVTIRRVEQFIEQKRQWILQAIERSRKNRQRLLYQGKRVDYLRYKEQTRALVLERLAYFNHYYQLTYRRITIRNQKRQWGSCSKQGNLNFNYRLVLLPSELCDYVIVHELCHLQVFNHSKQFWQFMEQTLPTARQLAKTLRKL